MIGSVVRQDKAILKKFLESLSALKKPKNTWFYFIKNNNQHEANEMIDNWLEKNNGKCFEFKIPIEYIRNEKTHYWSAELCIFIASMKNALIKLFLSTNCDYLFLTDSDNCLHPKTLEQMMKHEKDIMTEIQWCSWYPDEPLLPNVWIYQPYILSTDFLNDLQTRELVQIGGCGGCYLIKRKVLEAGVDFEPIPTLRLMEDRYFAIRAHLAGFDMWCDMRYPTFHIYRMSDLELIKNGWVNRSPEKGTMYRIVDGKWKT